MLKKLLLALVVVATSAAAFGQADAERPRNVVFMIPDGFGPASLTLARLASGEPLALDGILTGTVGTTSANSYITDSGASASAYATGHKVNNSAISVDTLGRPLGTVLQGARDRGMLTGLVTTTEITHATPAAFAAHVPDRAMTESIATQLLDHRVDLLIGGGRHYFLPDPDGRRGDGRNLIEEAGGLGYQVILEGVALPGNVRLPLLALIAEGHLAYEIDRHRTDEPSLAEMTRLALDLLATGDDGFFLMVEGGRIDHAAHSNDAAGHLHDILAYDDAVRVALDFARADGNTLIVSVGDHETGGMTVGRDGQYFFRPDVLLESTGSVEWIADEAFRRAGDAESLTVDILADVLREAAPLIGDLDEEDYRLLEAALPYPERWSAMRYAMHVVSRSANVGWTTPGHTAVDVTLHAYGPGSHRLAGFLENHEVGRIVAELLEIDLDALTERVRGRGAHAAPVD